MYKGCIFDLDGTLINSLDDLADSTNAALRQFGFPEHRSDAYRHFVGDGVMRLIERAVPAGTDADTVAAVKRQFDYHYDQSYLNKTRPYDGILQLLEQLRVDGVRLAVVSNKPDTFVGKIVRELFPVGTFDFITGKRPGIETKPNPQLVFLCMDELGLSGADCVYIGDSDVDVRTAANASLPCIGVAWGFRGKEELRVAGCTEVVEDCAGLYEAIRSGGR